MKTPNREMVIRVERLGKRYELGGNPNERYTALRDVIAQSARSVLGRQARPSIQSSASEPFWALRDINFEIEAGEVVGVIGRNGAGKSTLLKILSRITEPTEGSVKIRGRIASLLEVGTGFHPELTGRENIFLNGAILGMKRTEIRAKFDEIVAFAEIERFLDTPVKRYSSGMYVRLAFAVAAHLEPEILIVDEVLAVGDAEFQKKCLGKMRQVATGEGRTVLFVSHQMSAVENLCPRAIVLSSGTVKFDGAGKEAIRFYLSESKAVVSSVDLLSLRRRGDATVMLTSFSIQDNDSRPLAALSCGDEARIVLGYQSKPEVRVNKLVVGISIHGHSGEVLTVFYSDFVAHHFSEVPATGEIICTIPDFPFSPGQYYVGARVVVNGLEADWPQDFIGVITVEAGDYYGSGAFGQHSLGPILVRGRWDVRKAPDNL